jgi:hypothetical protein
VNRILRMILLATVILTACAPVKTQPPTTTTAVAPSETSIPSPTFTSTPTTTPEPLPTPAPLTVNDPTHMEYEALRAGPVEMTVNGEVVSIQDFVKNYVETGRFSDYIVKYAEEHGTLPTEDPPTGGYSKNSDRYEIMVDDTPKTATKLINLGNRVGEISAIRVSIESQGFAVSQGVWRIEIPSPSVGDVNKDGRYTLWVRGVVLRTGDPEHPYVGVPLVHIGADDFTGGFEAYKAYKRGYCRPDFRFAVMMGDPAMSVNDYKLYELLNYKYGKPPSYLATIQVLANLGIENDGFTLSRGLAWTGPFSNVEAGDVDPSLRQIEDTDVGWFADFLGYGRFDYEKTRRVIMIDPSFFQ